ncbi:minor capsid protein [Clostridium beijerinckii]|uniref:minor capsid protein n=1 Tax=Clostridium beijerinckii TaxID=1520 RepID=UPI001833BE86|nr:minor capsid protein [Clostridium beijerinckii]NOW03225.1 SPP1 gp7 family putative phage head morphogenesis protein [Clostridium beijerinckii]NYC03633.1 SPP1 gp7 family putative phage head morphogenesis protein [Clostridium beijerinckii]
MKQSKYQELYTFLTLYFADEIYKKSDNKILDMQKDQKKNRDDLISQIAKILLSYKIIDSTLSLTLGDINKLYTQLENTIDNTIKNELKNELYIMKEILSDTCLDKYNTNNYIYSLGKNFKLTQVNDKTLDKIINTKIKGEVWSDRLWSNKNETAKDLKLQVKQFLKGDINVNEIEKVIKTKYNANASNTDRLVSTEITRVQAESNEYWTRDHEIKQQLFLATLDSRTSNICRSKDGTVWDIDDSSKPIPPLHPHCRSVLVNLVNKNWRPKKRYDNQNKQNIDWTTYEEWSKEQS